MEARTMAFLLWVATFALLFFLLAYGLERAGFLDEACDCEACAHARRPDVTRAW
jgi:hypothetical protein